MLPLLSFRWIVAALALALAGASGQDAGVLQIRVVLADGSGASAPVSRHALLISDNPASAPPRRVLTGVDGTVSVRLRPGNYTVESETPVSLGGKTYEWRLEIDIVSGREARLDLSAANAEVETAASDAPASDPGFLLPRFKDSVVAIWTPTARGTGFAFDGNGSILTSQRNVGTATLVEVQVSPALKVAARVVAADRGVAVLRIDPSAAAPLKPAALTCDVPKAPLSDGQSVYTIGAPMRREVTLSRGMIGRSDADGVWSDFLLARGAAGGPVFDADGDIVGITTTADEANDRVGRSTVPVVRRGSVCEVVAAVANAATPVPAPAGTPLPVDPDRPFPADALAGAAKQFDGNLAPYTLTTSGFEVTFITPALPAAAQRLQQQGLARTGGKAPVPDPERLRPLLDFGGWSDYVAERPPVVLVRVTPRLVEGFWTKVGRYAARTQGVSIPQIKRLSSGFAHLRAYCGETEVLPIHPFKIEQRVSEAETIYEGLYAFDAAALRPDCGGVKLVLFSEKDPARGETGTVAPKIVEQVWQDFAAYRR